MFKQDQQQTYYFMHIPKTGGTSLTSVLDRFFKVENIYAEQLWWEVGNIEQVKAQSFQFIRGHFGLGAQLLNSNQLNTWSMLRNPVSMAHSTYQHIIRDKNTKKHQQVVSSQITFEAFLEDRRMAHLATNRLVKAMSFGLNVVTENDIPCVTRENYKFFRKGMNRKRKKLSKDLLLEAVKAELEKLCWFGIQEDFDFSVAMLCYEMNWPPVGESPKLNTYFRAAEFSDMAIKKINALNDLDNAFYQHAKTVYEQRKANFLTKLGLPADANISSVNELVDQNYQQKHLLSKSAVLHDSLEYKFSDILLGQNWHQREWHEEGQFYFRWTGAQAYSSIDFWLRPNDYQIIVQIINAIDYSVLDELNIEVNGQQVEYRIKQETASHKLIIVVNKELLLDNGLLRLSISNIVTSSHDLQFNSGDNRKVGLAVKKIDIMETFA